MPPGVGTLNATPARVIQQLLVALGLGTDPDDPNTPPSESDWPVHYSREPDQPDQVITVYDTAGRVEPRSHVDGYRITHYGILTRIRSFDPDDGGKKGRDIAVAYNERVYRNELTVDGNVYRVYSISNQGDVIPLGKDKPRSDRNLFTLNSLVSLRMLY